MRIPRSAPSGGAGVIAGLVLLALSIPAPAVADVTVEEKAAFDGFGGMAIGASESTTTLQISGDRLRQESAVRMAGGFMKQLGGQEGMKTASITRLDQKLLYNIDFQSRSYTEMSFDQIRQAGEDAMAALQGGMPPPGGAGDRPEMSCQPVDVKAQDTGEKETIGGFATRRFRIDGRQACTNQETKESCTFSYEVSLWNTPAAGDLEEVRSFMSRQAEAMGFDMARIRSMSMAAGAMMGGGAEGLEPVLEELSKVEGFPIRTKFQIFAEGNCGMGPGGSGAGGQAGLGAMSKFLGRFKKGKEQPEKAEAASGGQPAPGRARLFGMTSEVVSVSAGSIPPEAFDPPAGFKKRDRR